MHGRMGSCMSGDGSPKKNLRFPLNHVSGENAFDMIRERELERHRMNSNAFYQAERSSAPASRNRSPAKETTNEPQDQDLRPTSTDDKQKEGVCSGESKPKSRLERPSSEPIDEDRYATRPTARASIEAKSERRIFKMMGVENLSPNVDEGVFVTQKFDFTRKSMEEEKDQEDAQDTTSAPSRSPSRKKFFGINVPSFRSRKSEEVTIQRRFSTPETPEAPPKAAQFLGSLPARTRSNLPRKLKTNESGVAAESNNGSKTPSEASSGLHSAAASAAIAPRDGTSRFQEHLEETNTVDSELQPTKPDQVSIPPTPPEKDKPADSGKLASRGSITPDLDQEPSLPTRGDFRQYGVQVPLQHHSTFYQHYYALPHGSQPYLYGHYSGVGGFNVSSPAPWTPRLAGYRFQEPSNQGNQGESVAMLASLYTPSLYSNIGASSGSNSSQKGRNPPASELVPPSTQDSYRVTPSTESIQIGFQPDGTDLPAGIPEHPHLQPPQTQRSDTDPEKKPSPHSDATSADCGEDGDTPGKAMGSSQEKHPGKRTGDVSQAPGLGITPLLNSLKGYAGEESPENSQMEFARGPFIPMHPSAVPSPLRLGMPFTDNSTLSDGSHILTHFGVMNHHLDVVSDDLKKFIEQKQGEILERLDTHRDEKLSLLSKGFSDVHKHLESVNQALGRMSEDVDGSSSELSRFIETMQSDLIAPLEQLTKANTSLQAEVGQLHEAFGVLQKKIHHVDQTVRSWSTSNNVRLEMPHSPDSAGSNPGMLYHGGGLGQPQTGGPLPDWGRYVIAYPQALAAGQSPAGHDREMEGDRMRGPFRSGHQHGSSGRGAMYPPGYTVVLGHPTNEFAGIPQQPGSTGSESQGVSHAMHGLAMMGYPEYNSGFNAK